MGRDRVVRWGENKPTNSAVLATVLDFAGHLPAWGTAPPR